VFWEPNEARWQVEVLDLRALQYIDNRLTDLLHLDHRLSRATLLLAA